MSQSPETLESAIRSSVQRALEEDLVPDGDLTAALVSPELFTSGTFTARQDGVLAGVDCATNVAIPERWLKKLRAVLSAVRTFANGPSRVAKASPALNRSPSLQCQDIFIVGSTCRKVSVAQSTPANTPS